MILSNLLKYVKYYEAHKRTSMERAEAEHFGIFYPL